MFRLHTQCQSRAVESRQCKVTLRENISCETQPQEKTTIPIANHNPSWPEFLHTELSSPSSSRPQTGLSFADTCGPQMLVTVERGSSKLTNAKLSERITKNNAYLPCGKNNDIGVKAGSIFEQQPCLIKCLNNASTFYFNKAVNNQLTSPSV